MKTSQLESVLTEIAQLSGLATTSEEAEKLGLTHYLHLEYSSAYGGWRLVNVAVKGGGHAGAFGGNGCESRLKTTAMYQKLDGIYQGLKIAKSIN